MDDINGSNSQALSAADQQSKNDGHHSADQEQDDDVNNVYKHKGQIEFRMTNFKAFSEGTEPKEVLSEPVVYINGLPWRILAKHNDDASFGLFLCCFGDETDMAWNCLANKQLSVLPSAKRGQKCQMKEGNPTDYDRFDAKNLRWGWEKFAKFDDVMNEQKGFYDAKDDAVTFKAQVITQQPNGMPGLRTVDTLRVNGQLVYVNKFMLAAYSNFFREFFFGDKTTNIQIDSMNGNAVPLFERLIATMEPTNAALDDDCVEGVLMLASQFLLDCVKNRCAKFLLTKSKKSAICKFRLAHQCGITAMKKQVLEAMNRSDFEITGPNFMDAFLDYNKMDRHAMNELRERHRQLFGTSPQ
ncbi:hypothetical protein niasHT_028785 [Heterodera trifolii]|uniref:BTB domain-containing protein n=1 Tax=Heterodera trifolii TaxID=157864 RepID=A0ABD2KQJ5_9BILA